MDMDGHNGLSEEEIREMEKKEFRKEFPSGWMEVSRYETLVLIIDALLETPASREFTIQELADKAGSTKKSVNKRISSLEELGIVEKLEKSREDARYTLNNQSPITQKLYELNDTVNRVKEGELPLTITREPASENINAPNNDSQSSRFKNPAYDLDQKPSNGGFAPSDGAMG